MTRDATVTSNSNSKEEEEDELEALRLAALESLRAKGLPPPVVLPITNTNPNQVNLHSFYCAIC